MKEAAAAEAIDVRISEVLLSTVTLFDTSLRFDTWQQRDERILYMQDDAEAEAAGRLEERWIPSFLGTAEPPWRSEFGCSGAR